MNPLLIDWGRWLCTGHISLFYTNHVDKKEKEFSYYIIQIFVDSQLKDFNLQPTFIKIINFFSNSLQFFLTFNE